MRVYRRLHWLLMQQAISLDDIWSKGWLPEKFRPPSKRGKVVGLFRASPQIDYYEGLVNKHHKGREQLRDSSRERRHHRLSPANGRVVLTLSRDGASEPEPVSENANLVNVGLGGAGILIPDTDRPGADLSRGSLLVDVQDGTLADVKSYANLRGYVAANGGLRVSLEWSEPQRTIVELVS